jgi:hypothetical protein
MAEVAGLGIKEKMGNAEIAEEENAVNNEGERIEQQSDEKFVNVAGNNNTEDLGLTNFYNKIADIARTGYGGGLQCGTFVRDMIRDKLKDGKDIVKKVFPNGLKQANVLFDEFENNTNPNLKHIPATTIGGLKTVQDEADKGSLVIAVFKNDTHASPDGAYHGHIAFVGCIDLTMGTDPAYKENGAAVYDGMTGRDLPESLRLVLVQAGHYKGRADQIGNHRQDGPCHSKRLA